LGNAGKVIGYNGAGTPVEKSVGDTGDAASLATTQTVYATAKDARWVQAGVGSVERTLDAKLKDLALDVRDFGAKWNNIDNDTVAVKLTIAEAASRDAGGVILIPPGIGDCE